MVKLTNSDIMNTASGAVSTSNAKDFTGTVLTGSAAATGFIGALKDTAAASRATPGSVYIAPSFFSKAQRGISQPTSASLAGRVLPGTKFNGIQLKHSKFTGASASFNLTSVAYGFYDRYLMIRQWLK